MSHAHDQAEATALQTARDLVARNREGTLLADDRPFPIKFVADPITGDLIAPVPEEALDASNLLLFVPDESFDAIQLLVEADLVPESALTDRWCAYHLAQNHPHWARLTIDSAKHDRWVFTAEQLSPPNPIAADEPALCRLLNADKPALARLARSISKNEAPDPVCVGVNSAGAYIRARFSVLLAPFDPPARNAEDARDRINLWLTAPSPR
ncbi:MAG: hypothetical protein H6812_01215 [Phycisphaeraceae bacterium]|nr:hypothetical protein [Phycisphaerales bacterium]MCB9841854.1 hypothetical protein [Phycisphaeraceae bacterium]